MSKHNALLGKKFSEVLEGLSQAMEDILTESEYLNALNILYSIVKSISKEKYEVSRLMFQGVFIECEKSESTSITILSNIIIKECECIFFMPVYKLKNDENYVYESLENTVNTIYERLNNPATLRLSSNITDVALSKNEFFLLMALLNECNSRILNNNSLTECMENMYNFTYFARHGIQEHKYTEELYKKIDCILASLSTRDKQMARDVAEEVMFCSENDNESLFGYLILSSVYTSHKLHIESLIYNLSAIIHLKSRGSISQEFKFSILKNCIICLRDLKRYESAKKICLDLINSKCFHDDYTEAWAYHMLCGCIVNDEAVISCSNIFLMNNIEKIIARDLNETRSWFSLLSEIQRIHGDKSSLLTQYVDLLKQKASNNEMSGYYTGDDIATSLRCCIDNAQASRNIEDIANETKMLYPIILKLVNNIEEKYEDKIDDLILCHYALSRPFSTRNIPSETFNKIEILCHNEDSFCKYYLKSLKNYIDKNKESCYIFLFEVDNFIHAIVFDSSVTTFYKSILSIESFIESKNFILKDISTAPPSLVEQNTININIQISEKTNNITFIPSTRLSNFPINLIKNHNTLLSSNKSVSWATPSLFKNDSMLAKPEFKNLLIKVFDNTDRLTMRECSNLQSGSIVNSTDIKLYSEDVYQDVICFIGHGRISANDNFEIKTQSGYIEHTEIKYYCNCKVAIFFVCFSGSLKPNVFSNNIRSLTTDLTRAGIHHVVAPVWTLSATIIEPWLKKFIWELRINNDVASSAFLANRHIKSLNFYLSDYTCLHHFIG